MGQGRDNAKIFLANNPDIADEIDKQIRANADKLVLSRGAKSRKSVAADIPAPPVRSPSASPVQDKQVSSAPKASIDITVDDE